MLPFRGTSLVGIFNIRSVPTSICCTAFCFDRSPVAGLMGPNFPGKNFETDVEYLVGLSCLSDRLGDFWLEFSIRGNKR